MTGQVEVQQQPFLLAVSICELMMISALDTNAVVDKFKHDKEKPTRHSIFVTFKDTSCQSIKLDIVINSPIMPKSSKSQAHLCLVSLKRAQILWRGGFAWSCLVLSDTALESDADVVISSQIPTASNRECLLDFDFTSQLRTRIQLFQSFVKFELCHRNH